MSTGDQRLLGRLEEFQRQAEKRFDQLELNNKERSMHLDHRFAVLEKKINSLLYFKWKISGIAIGAGLCVGGLVHVVTWFIKGA